jgi:putative inorganic carbon (hco3(-)) transporter
MQQIITLTLYALTIIIPLVFTPSTSELFEFPKFLILIAGTLIITATWIYHFYTTRNFKIKIDPIGYAVLTYLLTQTIATIFSIHPYTSFWGYYGRFHGGLLTTICYTILYFAATNWLDTKSTLKIINISIKTSIFVALLAILEHYNYSLSCIVINQYTGTLFTSAEAFTNACWSAATNPTNRSFSLLGQPNWLAAYLIPHIFLALYTYSLKNSKKIPLSAILTFLVLVAALLFTRSRSGFLAFILAYVTYFLLKIRTYKFKKIKSTLITYSLLTVITVLAFGSPYTNPLTHYFQKSTPITAPVSQGTVLENGGTESGDIRKIVWSGALTSILQHPIVGSGPETFAYTYYLVRPSAHNLTSEWDFLYNKAHNEYLNTAAGAGILGLLAYLYLHYAIFAESLKTITKSKKINQEEDEQLRQFYPVLGATIVAFTVTSFFGFSVIPVYFTLVLFAALASTLTHTISKSESKNLYYLYFILPLLLIYPFRIFLSDSTYALGKKNLDANQVAAAIPLLQKAISYRPGLDLFHASLAEAYALSDQKDQALNEAETNRKLNRVHLNFYRSRAKTYLTLAAKEPAYYTQAAQEIEMARALAPTDPKLTYNLGLIYTRTNQLALAEKELRETIVLKPNYAEPYYALTLLYEQTKKTNVIPELLTQAKTNLATYSAQLKEKIDKYTIK